MTLRNNFSRPKVRRQCQARFKGSGSKGRQRAVAASVVFLLNAGLGGAPALAQDLESNHQFIERLCHKIAQRATAPLARLPQQPLVMTHRTLGEQSVERLLYQELIEVAQEEESREVFASADSQASAVRLDFKILAFKLTYRKLPAGWWRTGRVRRAATMLVDFDLRHARSGAVYFQGSLNETQADTLSSGEMSGIETTGLAFTVGTWDEPTARRKFWEPLLLVAATGAVIYAFYSLRSH